MRSVHQIDQRIDIMRNQFVLALLATTLSGAAFAAPEANQDMDRAAMASVPVVGSTYKLSRFDYDGVQGTYALDDGRHLRVTARQRKLYAEIGSTSAEIVPVAQNRFATRDDSLRVTFDQIPYATEVRVSELAK
jgi:hypothetical protein